jgi:hypothetical protein
VRPRPLRDEQLRSLRDDVTKWQRECLANEQRFAEQQAFQSAGNTEEAARLEALIAVLRDDVTRAQQAKGAVQRDMSEAVYDAERRVQLVQDALDHERVLKHRLHDELRGKEHLCAEMQGNVRMLSSRVAAKDEDMRRLEAESHDSTTRIHDAHTQLGKKDAMIGQLSARLRVYESKGAVSM